MSRRLGPYAPLSATYASDDAIIEAGEAAELLYCRALAFCSTSNSDGYITDAQLMRYVAVGMKDGPKRAAKLVSVGAWERVDGGYIVRSWLKWNKSSDELGQQRKKDRERKADRNPEPIPPDFQPDSRRIPDGQPPDSGHDSERIPPSRPRARTGDAQPQGTGHFTTHHSTALDSTDSGTSVPPESLTVNQRSKRLTDTYAAIEPMCKWPAVNGIVVLAIKTQKWTDQEIHDALLRLAKESRSVTVDSLRTELVGFTPRRRDPTQPTPRNAQNLALVQHFADLEAQQQPNRGEIA